MDANIESADNPSLAIHKKMALWLEKQLKHQEQQQQQLPVRKKSPKDGNYTESISSNNVVNKEKIAEQINSILNATTNTLSDNSDNYIVNNNDLNRISENEVLIPIMNMQNLLQGDDNLINGQISASPAGKYCCLMK